MPFAGIFNAPYSYHEFQELLVERGAEVDHTIGWRCVQRHVQELEERTRSNLEPTSKPRRVTLLIFAIHPPKGRDTFQTVQKCYFDALLTS